VKKNEGFGVKSFDRILSYVEIVSIEYWVRIERNFEFQISNFKKVSFTIRIPKIDSDIAVPQIIKLRCRRRRFW